MLDDDESASTASVRFQAEAPSAALTAAAWTSLSLRTKSLAPVSRDRPLLCGADPSQSTPELTARAVFAGRRALLGPGPIGLARMRLRTTLKHPEEDAGSLVEGSLTDSLALVVGDGAMLHDQAASRRRRARPVAESAMRAMTGSSPEQLPSRARARRRMRSSERRRRLPCRSIPV